MIPLLLSPAIFELCKNWCNSRGCRAYSTQPTMQNSDMERPTAGYGVYVRMTLLLCFSTRSNGDFHLRRKESGNPVYVHVCRCMQMCAISVCVCVCVCVCLHFCALCSAFCPHCVCCVFGADAPVSVSVSVSVSLGLLCFLR